MGVSLPVLGVPGVLGGGVDVLNRLIAGGLVPFFAKFTEVTGSALVNYGSAGAALNGVISGATQGQLGAKGAIDAYLFDKIDDYIDIPSGAAIDTLATYTWGALVTATSVGENNVGTVLARYGASGGSNARFVSAALGWTGTAQTDGTHASSTTADSFIGLSTWTYIFLTYDDLGDRKVYLSKYTLAGGFVPATYATQVAGTGTLWLGQGFRIGNWSTARTWDGLISKVFIANVVLDAATLTTIAKSAIG